MSNCDFDPNDYVSYDYKLITREEVKEILGDAPIGTFLLRDSLRDLDQKVLCVKEAPPSVINSYKIIEKVDSNGNKSYFILGKQDLVFQTIPEILKFYSAHYLNQSPLIKPAFCSKKVIAIHDFQESSDDPSNDLHFLKDEILTVLDFTIYDKWWKAKNRNGQIGLIPTDFVKRIKLNDPLLARDSIEVSFNSGNESSNRTSSDTEADLPSEDPYGGLIECPFKAKVVKPYTPSPYQKSHIELKKGQIVNVLEMKPAGIWYGEVDNLKGLFPFIYVEVVNE